MYAIYLYRDIQTFLQKQKMFNSADFYSREQRRITEVSLSMLQNISKIEQVKRKLL